MFPASQAVFLRKENGVIECKPSAVVDVTGDYTAALWLASEASGPPLGMIAIAGEFASAT
jgi:hypothetical protein